jgi:hypothetical protein
VLRLVVGRRCSGRRRFACTWAILEARSAAELRLAHAIHGRGFVGTGGMKILRGLHGKLGRLGGRNRVAGIFTGGRLDRGVAMDAGLRSTHRATWASPGKGVLGRQHGYHETNQDQTGYNRRKGPSHVPIPGQGILVRFSFLR